MRQSLSLSALALVATFSSVAQAQTSQVVDAGSYLVTVSYFEGCSPSALDLSKSWTYAAAASDPSGIDVASLSVAGRVLDNVIRPAVCRSGYSVGTIVVAAGAETELAVAEAGLELDGVTLSVESIDEVRTVAKNKKSVTLAAGEYLVEVQGWDGCNGGSEVNLVRELHVNYPASVADRLTFKSNGIVSDNWIRTAVCRSGDLTGTAHVVIAKKTTLVAPQGYKILKASKVLAKSSL
jgi:hypothetical protein